MNHRNRIKGGAAAAAVFGATALGGGALLTAALLSGGCERGYLCTHVDVPSVAATIVCSDEARDAVVGHDDAPLIIEMRLDDADPWAEARCHHFPGSATTNVCAAGSEPVVARCRDPWNRYNEGGRFHVRARQGELVSEETTITVTGDRCHPITVDIDLMLHLPE
mgnify:FL=1